MYESHPGLNGKSTKVSDTLVSEKAHKLLVAESHINNKQWEWSGDLADFYSGLRIKNSILLKNHDRFYGLDSNSIKY